MADINQVQLPDGSQYNIKDDVSGYASETYVQNQISGITKSTIGLGNVDNTSDANKPVSTAQQTALNGKTNTSMIAHVQTTLTADMRYVVGDEFIYEGNLYKATAIIPNGDAIIINTNCTLSNTITEQLSNVMSDVVNVMFPIGAVYMTIDNTNPSTFFSGTTWEMLSDGYLRNNASAATGGSRNSGSTTLTTNQIPSHNHTGTAQAAYAYNNNYIAQAGGSQNDCFVSWATTIIGTANTMQEKTKHSHTLSINNTGGGQGHTHTVEPTYTRVYAWKRTA